MTIDEFRDILDTYIEQDKREEIAIVENGNVLFHIVPTSTKSDKKWFSFMLTDEDY